MTIQDEAATKEPMKLFERVLRIAFFVLLVVFAVIHLFLSPLPFVVLGWFLEEGIVSHKVHETSFGLIFVITLLGLLALMRRPDDKLAQMWQVAIPIWLAILAILLVGEEVDPVILVFLVMPLILMALHPGRKALIRPPTHLSRTLIALTVVAAVPLTAFALAEFRIGQEASAIARDAIQSLPDSATDRQYERVLEEASETQADFEIALHYGHWSAMGAYALIIVFLAGMASLRIPGWRLTAWAAGVAASGYGLASLLAPTDASAASRPWAVLAIAWGVTFIAVAEREVKSESLATAEPSRSTAGESPPDRA